MTAPRIPGPPAGGPPGPRTGGPTAQQARIEREAAARGLDVGYIDKKPHLIKDPIQPASWTPNRPVEEYSFEWWFNYFWAEGRRGGNEHATGDERDRFWWVVAQMFDAASLPKTTGDAVDINETGRGLKLHPHVAAFSPTKQRGILRALLTLGFEEFPSAFTETAQSLFAHLVTVPAQQGANNHVTFSLALGYRSDSRQWSAIQAQGIRARAHVPFLVNSMQMDAPWHPFADATDRAKLWFRRGVEDNCLHTVISIASKFDDALYFPRIDDASIYTFMPQLARHGALNDRWTPEVNQAAKAKRAYICQVELADGTLRYMMGSRTTILVFAFPPNFSAANTERYQRHLGGQSPFPERGVGAVPPEYVLAILDVLRVHHGPTADDGQTNFVRQIDLPKTDDAVLKSVLLTDDAVMAFRTYIAGHAARTNQPYDYPKGRHNLAIRRLVNDDAYGPAFRNGLGGTM